LPESWAASADHGTPGAINSVTGAGVNPEDGGGRLLVLGFTRALPNPFTPGGTIHQGLDRARRVQLTVYDISGRQVASLLDRRLPAGPHSLAWAGRGSAGRPLGRGYYLLRMKAAECAQARKILLLSP